MWDIVLKCPRCQNTARTLQSKGLYPRVGLVLESRTTTIARAACGGTFIVCDRRLLEQLLADGGD